MRRSSSTRSARCPGLTAPISPSIRTLRAPPRVAAHRISPASGHAEKRRIETEDDVRDAIELLRLNYDRAVDHHGLPAAS